MSTLKIFASFEYHKDRHLKNQFFAQAMTNTNHRIHNSSLREDYPNEEWKKKARAAVRECDVVVVLVGEDTHNASGVVVETDMARSFDIPTFQIAQKGRPYKGLERLEAPMRWRWKQINAKLDEIAAKR